MAAEDYVDFEACMDEADDSPRYYGACPLPYKNRFDPIKGLPRHGEPWTDAEEKKLRHLWVDNNVGLQGCSEKMGRTKIAIEARLEKLGLDVNRNNQSLATTRLQAGRELTKKVNNAMTMNLQHLLALLQKGYTTVAVSFLNPETGGAQGSKTYDYKVPESVAATLAKGDLLVVPARGSFAVVKVDEVHATPQIDVKDPLALKWVVCKVDRAAYDDQAERETKAIAQVEVAERRRAQEEALQTLLGTSEDREAFLALINAK